MSAHATYPGRPMGRIKSRIPLPRVQPGMLRRGQVCLRLSMPTAGTRLRWSTRRSATGRRPCCCCGVSSARRPSCGRRSTRPTTTRRGWGRTSRGRSSGSVTASGSGCCAWRAGCTGGDDRGRADERALRPVLGGFRLPALVDHRCLAGTHGTRAHTASACVRTGTLTARILVPRIE